MNKKSRIKSTLDSLFTGGKISSEESKEKQEVPQKDAKSVSDESAPTMPQEKKPDVAPEPKLDKEEPAKIAAALEKSKLASIETANSSKAELIPPVVEKNEPKPAEEKPVPSVVEKKKSDEERVGDLAESIHKADYSIDDDDEQLVIFTLGKELYGVTIHSVESIIKLQAITQVPRTAAFILGVTNLRGTVVPVLDLRRRFNLASCEDTSNTRIVIINAEGGKVGIVVDEVTEVLKVPRNFIQPPPAMSTTVESAFINGIARINDRLVILLDLEKVLASSSRQYNR